MKFVFVVDVLVNIMPGRAAELKSEGNACYGEKQYDKAKKYYLEGKLTCL